MKLEMNKKMKDFIIIGDFNIKILKDIYKYMGIGEYYKGKITLYQNYRIKYKNDELDLFYNYNKRSIILFNGSSSDVSEMTVSEVIEQIKLWQKWVKDKEVYMKEQKLKEMF